MATAAAGNVLKDIAHPRVDAGPQQDVQPQVLLRATGTSTSATCMRSGECVEAAPRMTGALVSSLRALAPLWPALLGVAPAACVEVANRPASADLLGVAGPLWQRP